MRKPVLRLGQTGFLGAGGNPYTRSLKDLPVTNLTVFEALIFIFSPVLGFTPVRALREATLKVPIR